MKFECGISHIGREAIGRKRSKYFQLDKDMRRNYDLT